MGVKRIREDGELEALDVVKCLMLLSKVGSGNGSSQNDAAKKQSADRVFVCKTCNRQFSSFQALGGHRASHKKPKLMAGDLLSNGGHVLPSPPVKPKTHECSICGLEFAIGQALGGHMRRHKHGMEGVADRHDHQPQLPVLKKSNSSKRVMCLDLDLDLDLNLAPPGRKDDLKLQLMAPTVDRFMYKYLKI